MPMGLKLSVNILYALLGNIPVALFFIAFGLLCGSVFSSKQVGGICGALLTNVSAWLSGIWFDINLVGGAFKAVADALPFIHAVEMERMLFNGETEGIWFHFAVVLLYTVGTTAIAVFLFLRQSKNK